MPKTATLHNENVQQVRAVEELGSDPNSAKQPRSDQHSHPELGSDPNSAGHTCYRLQTSAMR
jgi:hypothetical protein